MLGYLHTQSTLVDTRFPLAPNLQAHIHKKPLQHNGRASACLLVDVQQPPPPSPLVLPCNGDTALLLSKKKTKNYPCTFINLWLRHHRFCVKGELRGSRQAQIYEFNHFWPKGKLQQHQFIFQVSLKV